MRTYERTRPSAVALLAGRVSEAGMLLARGGVMPEAAVSEVVAEGPERAGAAADMAVERAVELAWQRGWLPEDLVAACPRDLVPLVVDALAAACSRHPAARLHPRWRAQLAEAGAVVWWSPGARLPQWAHRWDVSFPQALVRAVEAVAALVALPQLPQLVPSPGAVEALPEVESVDRRLLVRVRALLAKAESTPFPQEAEALSAKAQELMSRHAFERALTESGRGASARRVWLAAPYQAPKARLVDAVAAANRCRTVFYAKLGCVCVVGHDTDLEIVSVLAASLCVQAERALLAAPSRSRAYRHSFLVAYAQRVGERLASALAPDRRVLPVLARRRADVDAHFDAIFPGVRATGTRVSSPSGWGAGRAAADRADLLPARPRIAG